MLGVVMGYDDCACGRWLYMHQCWICSLIFWGGFVLLRLVWNVGEGERFLAEWLKCSDWIASCFLIIWWWIEKCCEVIDVVVRRNINWNTCLFLRGHHYFLKLFFVFAVSASSAPADGPAAAVAAICVPTAACPVTVSCHGMSQRWYSLEIWLVLVNL